MKKVPEAIAIKLRAATEKMPEASGFDFSIDDAARMSGVPRATLYYYFSGKEDLARFYLNDLTTRTATAIEKAAAGEGPAPERLSNIMTSVVQGFAEHPRMCIEMASAFKASDDHAEAIRNIDRSVMAPLRETLIEGADSGHLVVEDPELAAAAIIGALHQASLARLLSSGTLDAEEVSSAVIPLLMEGLKA